MKLFGFYIFRRDPRPKKLDEEILKKIRESDDKLVIITPPRPELPTDMIKMFNDRYENLLIEHHRLKRSFEEQREYFMGVIKTYRDAYDPPELGDK